MHYWLRSLVTHGRYKFLSAGHGFSTRLHVPRQARKEMEILKFCIAKRGIAAIRMAEKRIVEAHRACHEVALTSDTSRHLNLLCCDSPRKHEAAVRNSHCSTGDHRKLPSNTISDHLTTSLHWGRWLLAGWCWFLRTTWSSGCWSVSNHAVHGSNQRWRDPWAFRLPS